MIRRLSDDVRERLRTGVALTNVAQCVEELVLNSVDAGATCIAVRVDLQSLKIQVVDNGTGITKEQLSFVGERYATSKCKAVEDLDNLRYFGYRGEALASLCSASTFMEITTRPTHSTATFSKCFHKGKHLSVTEPNVPRAGTGTTVTVHNLFYNLPVRKKSVKEGLELEKIRYRVAGLALIWPLISFSLRDDVTGNVILQTRKCSGILATFSSLFGGVRAKHMREVETQDNIFKVSGYVSRENYSRPDLQFVFVNRRLVLKSKVHKMLNGILGKSVLVRRRGNNDTDKYSRQFGQNRSPGGDGGSPTKLFERYAVYIIKIDCPLSAYDITFDPAKTLVEFHDWPELTKLIESMLMVFLKEENLLPSGELKDTEQVGTNDIADAAIKGHASTTPDDMGIMEDPFAGAEEGYDKDFHDNLVIKTYAQGISTYNNTKGMFSHAVRRPLRHCEEEDSEDLNLSRPKKSRQECDISGTSVKKQQHKGDLKSFNSQGRDVTAKKSPSGGSFSQSQMTEQDVSRCTFTEVSTASSCNDSLENLDDEDDEISLPPAVQPSKRAASNTAHKVVPSRKLQSQVSSSSSNSSLTEIRLPSQFAHTSSLTCLRAKLARKDTSFTSSNSKEATNVCISSLHKFKRSGTQRISRETACNEQFEMANDEQMEIVLPSTTSSSSKKPASVCSSQCNFKWSKKQRTSRETACVENSAGANETLTEIVLPHYNRPPLFRSKSLDSDGCQSHRDGRAICQQQSESSKRPFRSQFQVADDTCVRYTSNQNFDTDSKNRSKSKQSHCVTASCGNSSRECVGKSRNDSSKSHYLQFSHIGLAAHGEELTLKAASANRSHTQSIPADKSEGMSFPPRKQETDKMKTSLCKSRNIREEVQRPNAYGTTDVDKLDEVNPTMTRFSESECPAPISSQHDQGSTRLSSCSIPSNLLGLSPRIHQSTNCTTSAPKPGALSQASKLARLMRREEISSSDCDLTGSAEMANRKESNQRSHHTYSERSKKVFQPELNPYTQAEDSIVQPRHALHVQDLQDKDEQMHNFQDLTALEMLSSTGLIQTSHLNQRNGKHAAEARRQYPNLSLAQTCNEALGNFPREQSETCSAPASGIHHSVASSSLVDDVTSFSLFPATGESLAGSLRASQEHQAAVDPRVSLTSDSSSTGRLTKRSLSRIENYNTSTQPDFSFCATEVGMSEQCSVAKDLLGSVKPAGLAEDLKFSGDLLEPCDSHSPIEHPAYSQGSSIVRLPLTASSQTHSLVHDNCGMSIRKEQPSSQQETQGFAICSSQGFAPQLAEEGSMPFTADDKVLTNSIQNDSPASTQSVGFSPTASDPLLPDSEARLLTKYELETSAKRHSEIRHLGAGTRHYQSDTEKVTNSVTADSDQKEAVTDNTSVCDPTARGRTLTLIQEKKTGSKSSIAYKLFIARETADRMSKSSLVNSADNLSISQKDRIVNSLSCLEVTSLSCPESVCQNPESGLDNSCSSSDVHESQKDVILLASKKQNNETNCSGIPWKQRVISSISVATDSQDITPEVSSLCASSSTSSDCTARNQSNQSVMRAEPAQGAQETTKPAAQLHPMKIRTQTNKEENKTEHKQACACPSSDSVITGSESEPRFSTNNVPPVSCWAGVQTQQKAPVEPTCDLSFLSGAKSKSLLSSCTLSSSVTVDENPSCANDSSTCFEKKQKEWQAQMPAVNVSKEENSVYPSQQNDSFGDSVGDTALLMHDFSTTTTVGRDFKHPDPVSKSSMEICSQTSFDASTILAKRTPVCSSRLSSLNSVSDNELATGILPPKQETSGKAEDDLGLGCDSQGSVSDSVMAIMSIPETKVSQISQGSVSDSVMAIMSIPETKVSQISQGSVSDSVIAIMPMPETHVSQSSKSSDTTFTQSSPNSVPDSVIIQALIPDDERPVPEVTDTQAVTGTSNSNPNWLNSCTLVTPSTSKLNVDHVPFTQNAYNLISALSLTPSGGISDKAISSSLSPPHDIINTADVDVVGKEQGDATCGEVRGSNAFVDSNQTDCSHEDLTMTGRSRTSVRPDTTAEVRKEKERRKREGGETGDVMWIPVTDPTTGNIVYMNSGSGHTLTEAQWNQKKTELGHFLNHAVVAGCGLTSDALSHRPKEMQLEELSPLSHQTMEALLEDHLEADEEAAHLKWREGSKNMVCEESSGKSVLDILNTWENPVFKLPEQILQPARRTQAGKVAQSFFHPTTFTKNMLTNCKVVGQVDNKFVACLIPEGGMSLPTACTSSDDSGEGGLIVLFDQHAAHERIRLEQLISAVYEKDSSGGSKERRIQRCDVKPPRTVCLSEEDVRVMLSFREEFDRIGVVFDVDTLDRDRVHVHTIPACMAQREANDMKRGKDPLSYQYVEIMIREHTQLLLSTGGARNQLPQQVHRLLATHACKGAIKFGDRLSVATCQSLLSTLSLCDLPFQCAHGRPSIAPLLSLKQLKFNTADKKLLPNLWKLGQRNATFPREKDQ